MRYRVMQRATATPGLPREGARVVVNSLTSGPGGPGTSPELLERAADQGGGAIINTSSHAFPGMFGGTGYPAAKGGTVSLTRAMATALEETGVTCNAVCPGARTRLATARPDREESIERLHRRGVLSDLMRAAAHDPPDPEHVAPIYVYLASDRARRINGRLFLASGGYVGLFEKPAERLLALRNHRKDGPGPSTSWPPAWRGNSSRAASSRTRSSRESEGCPSR